MTKNVDGRTSRGVQRRAALVAAGLELAAEGGWPAVTTRAVATRADANPALVHYHFADTATLHRRVAEAAVVEVIDATVEALTAIDGAEALAAVVADLLAEPDERSARLTLAVLALAATDDEVRSALAAALARARVAFQGWLVTHRLADPSEAAGEAALLVAALDGLFLHRLVDDRVPAAAAGDALGRWLDARPGRRPVRRGVRR